MSTPAAGQDERIPVALYFDYICPFCYVASHRLQRLAAGHAVAVDYRFVEIHPDNPCAGQPLSALGYPAEQWERMTAALEAMVAADELPMAERRFTTNSRHALLLGRRVRQRRPERFLGVHNALFHAYFAEQRNIGDPGVLEAIADEYGVTDCLPAVSDPDALAGLLTDIEAAQADAITGVPTLRVGDRTFPGAVSVDTLEAALSRAQVEAQGPEDAG